MSEKTTAGEIVAWNMGGLKVSYKDVVDSLKSANLPAEAAKVLAPRHAFSRACKILKEKRVIAPVDETKDTITFQFTEEVLQNKQVDYVKEDILILNKDTGKVACVLKKDLEKQAQDLVNQNIEARNGGDLGVIVQRLFEGEADLIPIRDQGGAYIVPGQNQPFLEKVVLFISLMGGAMRRFPILEGTGEGTRSIKECMTVWLDGLIAEHGAAIEAFDDDTRHGTVERRVEKVRETKLKVEAYAEYLSERSGELLGKLGQLQERLVQKVEDMAKTEGGGDEPEQPAVQEEVVSDPFVDSTVEAAEEVMSAPAA